MGWPGRLLALLLATAGAAQAADLGLALDTTWDSNLSQGSDPTSTKSGYGILALASLSGEWELSRYFETSWTLFAAPSLWNRYHGLDQIEAGGELIASHRLGLGRAAPVLGVRTRLAREATVDALRRGWRETVEADLSERVLTPLSLNAALGAEQRTQDRHVRFDPDLPGDAFAGRGVFARIGAAWDAGASTRVNLSYQLRRGDIHVTFVGDPEDYSPAARALVADPVFGQNAFAERIDLLTRSWSAHVGVEAGAQVSIGVGLRHDDAGSGAGVRYGRTSLTLDLFEEF